MIEERRNLEKDCEELEQAVRKAFILSLEALHRDQKKREAALWQAAWIDWNSSHEDVHPQSFDTGNGASSGMGHQCDRTGVSKHNP